MFCVETIAAHLRLILTYFIIVVCMCVCVSVMYAPFLTILLIWTSSLSIKDLFIIIFDNM